jgi:hypothetical protein
MRYHGWIPVPQSFWACLLHYFQTIFYLNLISLFEYFGYLILQIICICHYTLLISFFIL